MLLRAAGQADGNAVFAADVFVADFVFGFAPRFVSEAVHPGDQARAVERRGMVARTGHGCNGRLRSAHASFRYHRPQLQVRLMTARPPAVLTARSCVLSV